MKTETVIVLNGSYHNSLTIVRSLARKGIPVIVGDKDRGIRSYFGEAMLSKYLKHRFLYPPPERNPMGFIEKINNISHKYGAHVVMPVGTDTFVTISAFRRMLSNNIKLPITDEHTFESVHDKYRCIKHAESIGVSVPKTILLKNIRDRSDLSELGTPLVVKPRKGAANFGIRIVQSIDEIMEMKNRMSEKQACDCHNEEEFRVFDDSDPMIQEYVDGPVVDACCVAQNGNIKGILTQIREKTLPPTGGYGVKNRTNNLPEVKKMSEDLLESIKWTGPAQVEFKLDSHSGKYKLMEINPKFWGTLALSVAAGMDFPYMAYKLAIGESVNRQEYFKENCVFRWVIPNEFLHVVQSEDRKRACKQYIKDFFRPAHYNIDLKDPFPVFSLILKLFNHIV